MVIMQQPPEITVAYLFTEHLAKGPRLMEMILERGNMFKALARVRGVNGHEEVSHLWSPFFHKLSTIIPDKTNNIGIYPES